MNPPFRGRPRILSQTLLALAATIASACSSPQPDGQAPAPLPPPAPIERVVKGEDNGLEIHIWNVVDRGETLRDALAPHAAAPVPLPADTLRAWRNSGMRIVAVPLDDLAAIRAHLPFIGRLRARWMAQTPAWTEIHRGGSLGPDSALRIDDESITVGAGAPRFILRTWVAPSAGDADAAIRPLICADLAVQHAPTARERDAAAALGAPRRIPLEREGAVFPSLTANLVLEEGVALVIAPEDPDVHWSADTTSAPPAPADADPFVLGPRIPAVPPAGDALLVPERDLVRGYTIKTLIILLPRATGEFHLLP